MRAGSWMGEALAEATSGPACAPVIGLRQPRPALPERPCVLDRGVLGGSAPPAPHASLGDAVATRSLRVPERLVTLLVKAPYEAVKRAEALGVRTELEAAAEGADWRGLTLSGREDAVAQAGDLLERMLLDLHRRHGLVSRELEARVAAAEAACSVAPESSEPSERAVRVRLAGAEEDVLVDKERGPVWFGADGIKAFGPSGDGRWTGKEWRCMSTTEREVLLITTARRQHCRRGH